jgi:hypothetical protein
VHEESSKSGIRIVEYNMTNCTRMGRVHAVDTFLQMKIEENKIGISMMDALCSSGIRVHLCEHSRYFVACSVGICY